MPDFCSLLNWVGNLMSNLIRRLPLFPGSLAMGIPSLGRTFSYPGWMISGTETLNNLPSRVVTEIVQPVRASPREIFWTITRSFPSCLNLPCGRSSMTKTRSAAIVPGCSLPFCGNVIFVPFFHPGFTSIVSISFNRIFFLHSSTPENKCFSSISTHQFFSICFLQSQVQTWKNTKKCLVSLEDGFNYPVSSMTFLDIFIFLVEPL